MNALQKKKFTTKLLMDLCIYNKKIIKIYGDGKNIIKTKYQRCNFFINILLIIKVRGLTNLGQYSFVSFIFKVADIFSKKYQLNTAILIQSKNIFTLKKKMIFVKFSITNLNIIFRKD